MVHIKKTFVRDLNNWQGCKRKQNLHLVFLIYDLYRWLSDFRPYEKQVCILPLPPPPISEVCIHTFVVLWITPSVSKISSLMFKVLNAKYDLVNLKIPQIRIFILSWEKGKVVMPTSLMSSFNITEGGRVNWSFIFSYYTKQHWLAGCHIWYSVTSSLSINHFYILPLTLLSAI